MDEKLSRGGLVAITVLRVFVGWHFLYEGLTKLNSAGWSAAGYMKQARGPFAGLDRLVHLLLVKPRRLAVA
jgi:thiosulfate dehydrogenase [quinone] large subunit